MLGECDDTLRWPSRRELTIQLLNQHADENHVTEKALIKLTTKGNILTLSLSLMMNWVGMVQKRLNT